MSSQSSLCSSHKHHVKYEGLFRIAPSGTKRFICELYTGFISRKEIFRKSFILSRNPWKDNDSIMADCRFTIEKQLKPLNMKLNIPLFLSVWSYMLKDEVTESQDIASLSRKSHNMN